MEDIIFYNARSGLPILSLAQAIIHAFILRWKFNLKIKIHTVPKW